MEKILSVETINFFGFLTLIWVANAGFKSIERKLDSIKADLNNRK